MKISESPIKNHKGGELSEQQKSENRKLSQSRVVCENAFAGVKRYGAVSQIYRNHKYDFDDKLMLTASVPVELISDGSISSEITREICQVFV